MATKPSLEAQVRNFVGVDRVDVLIEGVTLICGRNEQGKTSLLRAVSGALTRSACPIVLPGSTEEKVKESFAKKDFKMLVRNGTDKATVALIDEAGEVNVTWPSGDVEERGRAPKASLYATGVLRYGELPDNAKQVLLARIAGAEPTFEDFKGEAADKGFSEELTLAVWQQIQSPDSGGWDGTHTKAKENGAQVKGQWKEVSQDGNWGSQKGEDWKPTGLTEEEVAFCAPLIAASPKEYKVQMPMAEQALADDIATAQSGVDKLIASSAVDAAERAHLEQVIAEGKEQDLSALEIKIVDLERRDAVLTEELGALPSSQYSTLCCPWEDCGQPLELVNVSAGVQKLQKANQKPTDAELKARRDAIARKEGQRDGARQLLYTARQEHTAALAKVTAGEQAAARLSASESPSDGTALSAAREALVEAQAAADRCRRYIRASRLHRNILNNAKWIDLLAPEGARKTVLLRKLKPLNDRLRKLCEVAKCGIVRVRADRELEAETERGAIHYALLSEAAAMRADMMMQIAIAEIDKSDMIVIDRFDKFDGPNRTAAITAVLSTGIPTLIGCTFSNEKMPPRLSLPHGRTYWLDQGMAKLLDPNEAKAA